ncbi:MAG TPA: glycosyltransferase family 39 protein [candidate division Zixibacteria bacterium]|nr:glycosyltransferase family 39 protein [candidate division Zixibacteria bacterium]
MSSRWAWLIPLMIFVLGLSVRIAYLNQVSSVPTFELPIMDEKYHVHLAEQINSPEGYPDEPFYRAPLYPYFLAFLFSVTDDSFYWSRLIQLVLGSFLPLLIYVIAIRVFDRKIAFWSGLVSSIYPTLIFFESALLIESIMVLLTALLIWQLYRCQQNSSIINFILAGVLLGLAGLARPNVLMLGPFLFIWVVLVLKPKLGWGKSILRYALIGITAFMVILPVAIRNYTVGKDSVFIAWQGGFNFYIGNNRAASGWSATVPGIDMSWEGGYKQSIALAETVVGRDLKPSEVSDFWYDQTWKEIKTFPGNFAALILKKSRLLINGFEIPNNQSTYFIRDYSWIAAILLFEKIIFFPYGILAPLAIIGIGLSLKEWRRYLLLYLVLGLYGLSLLLFFVCDRFRQPIIPILILFAVFGVIKLVEMFKRRDKKNLSLVLFILMLLLLESNHDITGINRNSLRAEDYYIQGGAHLEIGNLAAAEREYNKSLAADPNFASAYTNLGLIASRRGDINRAAQNFSKAIQLDPFTLEPYFNYATVLIERQQYQPALDILLKAREIQPLNDFVHLKIGLTLYQLERKEEALKSIEESLRLNPNSVTAKEVHEQLIFELKK